MSILKDIFKVFNGSSWDEHYFKTSSDQVVHTKSDGTATTVQEELLAQNSALDSNTVFSTTEKAVGTWIDGKTLYRKTVVFYNELHSGVNKIPHGISNVDSAWVDNEHSYITTEGHCYPVTFYLYSSVYDQSTYGADPITTWVNRSNIIMNVNSGWSTTWKKVVTLLYTKL